MFGATEKHKNSKELKPLFVTNIYLAETELN